MATGVLLRAIIGARETWRSVRVTALAPPLTMPAPPRLMHGKDAGTRIGPAFEPNRRQAR
jgi:hypothetical protein